MELKYKSADTGLHHSFHVRREHNPYHEGNWHYHEEFELIYIIRGEGIRIVGDNMTNFRPPQLALVGSWLPHLWKNVESDEGMVDIVVIKFNSLFHGQDVFSIPEFSELAGLLQQSNRGLLFGDKTIDRVHDCLLQLSDSEGANRFIGLMQTLSILSQADDVKVLSSPDFTIPTTISGENRLRRIINFISDKFDREISMVELAREAAMTPSSLCRFFKKRTNKTIFQFINEFRIGKACQMLISGNQTITEICFGSGFNSLTSFNRVFKDYKKVTPSEYKEKYRSLNK